MILLESNENKVYTRAIADTDFVSRKPLPSPKDHKAFLEKLMQFINAVKERDKNEEWTYLHYAVLGKDADLTRALLNHCLFHKESTKNGNTRLNLESRNHEGYTALMYAVMQGDLIITQMLLEAGSHVDEKDNFQSTPLLEATVSGRIEIMHLLLNYRADPEKADPFGKTPLMHAAEGHLEILNILIENNANIHAKDFTGRTAGFFATSQHSALATQYTETECPLNKVKISNAMIQQEKIINALRKALTDLKEKEIKSNEHKKRKNSD